MAKRGSRDLCGTFVSRVKREEKGERGKRGERGEDGLRYNILIRHRAAADPTTSSEGIWC